MRRHYFWSAGALASLALGAMVSVLNLSDAHARKSPLEGQPVVRHKLELRDKRFELAPTFEMSVAADYKQVYSAGLKAEFHLSDMLSVGGMLFGGTSADTGLSEQIRDSLPISTEDQWTPTKTQFDQHLNRTPLHGAIHATLTPWFGKMSLFQKAFVNFDIYLRGGFGFAVTENDSENDTCSPVIDTSSPLNEDEDTNYPKNDCPHNAGFNPGLLLGAGMHVFINRWMALDLSFNNYMFSDNPSGLDADADLDVDAEDRRFLSHLFFGAGLSLYLPSKAVISP